MHYAAKTRRSFTSLFGLAFCAILVFEVWAHVLKPLAAHVVSPGTIAAVLSLVLYPILWAIAWVLWKQAERRAWQDKFQDYRALAEALRVQVAWNALGLTDSVDDSYLRKQRGELEWIRYGLRTWTWHVANYHEPAEKPTLRRDSLERIRRVWIDAQVAWFSREWNKQEQRFKKYHKRGRMRFSISYIITVLLVGVVIYGFVGSLMKGHSESAGSAVGKPEIWDHLAIDFIIAVIALFTVGAATAIAWLEKMAFAEHANQYRTMYNLFSYAATRFGEVRGEKDDACIEFFRELGQDALNENGDWLLMHRERRLELPIL
jgi:hypothetical protein